MPSNRFLLAALAVILILPFAFADSNQPTQITNKIYLSPFYRASIPANTNLSYSLNINPPDGFNSVSSAIITLDVYMSPTVTFTLWVNNQSCNNPNYVISTTFAAAGQARAYFDCSNVITQPGNYSIMLRSTSLTGSSTILADLTYINSPAAAITIHGTEYLAGDIAKVWLQLLDANRNTIDNASCFTDIYTPDNQRFLERAHMNFLEDGVYYYDLDSFVENGVYPTIALCYYQTVLSNFTASNGTIINGTNNANDYTSTSTLNQIYWKVNEANVGGIRRVAVVFNFTNLTQPNFSTAFVVDWVGRWDVGAGSGDIITIQWWNFTANAWSSFFNTVPNTGTSDLEVSNSLVFPVGSNLTQLGILKNNASYVRFVDSSIADGAIDGFWTDFLQVQITSTSGSQWTTVQGSSEIHISRGTDFGITAATFCGDASSACAIFTNNSLQRSAAGVIIDNITIFNVLNRTFDSHYTYATGDGVDCSSLLKVTRFYDNGTSSDITNDSTMQSVGSGTSSRCEITFPITFTAPSQIHIDQIITDNYQRWEATRANDLVQSAYAPILRSYCNSFNYTFPTFPLNTTLNPGANSTFCTRVLDDLYWQGTYFNFSQTINTSGKFEGYLTQERFYLQELYREMAIVIPAINNNSLYLNNLNISTALVNLVQIQTSQQGNFSYILGNQTIIQANELFILGNQTIIQQNQQLIINGMIGNFTQLRSDISAVEVSITGNFTQTNGKIDALALGVQGNSTEILNAINGNFSLMNAALARIEINMQGNFTTIINNQATITGDINTVYLSLTNLEQSTDYNFSIVKGQLADLNSSLASFSNLQSNLTEIAEQINQVNSNLTGLSGILTNLTTSLGNLTGIQNQLTGIQANLVSFQSGVMDELDIMNNGISWIIQKLTKGFLGLGIS